MKASLEQATQAALVDMRRENREGDFALRRCASNRSLGGRGDRSPGPPSDSDGDASSGSPARSLKDSLCVPVSLQCSVFIVQRGQDKGRSRQRQRKAVPGTGSTDVSALLLSRDDDLWTGPFRATQKRGADVLTTLAEGDVKSALGDFLCKDLDTFIPGEGDRGLFLKCLQAEGLAPRSASSEGFCDFKSSFPGFLYSCGFTVSLQVSIRLFLEAVRDGWSPSDDVAGEERKKVVAAMSWTGRTAVKRLVKHIGVELDSLHLVKVTTCLAHDVVVEHFFLGRFFLIGLLPGS